MNTHQQQSSFPPFPEHAKVAIYTRVSGRNRQDVSQSIEMQTAVCYQLATQLGFSNDHITVIADNPAATELSFLLGQIANGSVHVVVISREVVLFRDQTVMEVNTFIQLCRNHAVTVVTPVTTYDFSQEVDIQRFRLEAVEKTTYIRQYLSTHIHLMKEQGARQGYYDGRKLPPGYIVDRKQTRKITPYKPHADVIITLYQQAVEYNGDANELLEWLQQVPVLFPAFDEAIDPRTESKTTLHPVPGGYHISRSVLHSILADPNGYYIGTWTYKECVLLHNHTPIVPEELYWQVHYLFSRHQRPEKPQQEE